MVSCDLLKFGVPGSTISGAWVMDSNRLGFVVRDNASPRVERRTQAGERFGAGQQCSPGSGARRCGNLYLYLEANYTAPSPTTSGRPPDRPLHLPATRRQLRHAALLPGVWDRALTPEESHAHQMGLGEPLPGRFLFDRPLGHPGSSSSIEGNVQASGNRTFRRRDDHRAGGTLLRRCDSAAPRLSISPARST